MGRRKIIPPPGCIPTEEAAQQLHVSKDRLYQLVKEGRLHVYGVGNAFVFQKKEIDNFERNPIGRKRKNPTPWSIYRSGALVLITDIYVQVRAGKQQALRDRLFAVREANEYTFPGTIARYIRPIDEQMSGIHITLVWKSTEMPAEEARQGYMAMFQDDLKDLLDWETMKMQTMDSLINTL